MARTLVAALLASFAAHAPQAAAETLYVTDRLEIGVHEHKDIDSVIVAVVPSGTPLAVLERDGELAKVRLNDGITGWVDTRYVVAEKPNAALVEEYDAKLGEAVRSLGNARAEVEVLRRRVKELERDASTAANESRDAADVADPVALASSEDAAKLAEAKAELETLAEENRRLESRIDALETAASAAEETVSGSYLVDADPDPPPLEVRRGSLTDVIGSWSVWHWMLLAFVLLLAFALGGYVVDWQTRRRHGGFRV